MNTRSYSYHEGGSTSINGGAGDDSITNYGNNVTIDAGDGNDSIKNRGYYYGYGVASSINGGAGDDYIANEVNSVTLDGGSGNDTLNNWREEKSNVAINGGKGDDSINNVTNDSSIDGGDDNDTISNRGNNTTITGGDGDDSILNYNTENSYHNGNYYVYGTNVTILGGAGNDTIANKCGYSVSIDGGDGDDLIISGKYQRYSSQNISISGGTGNDTVSLESNEKNILIEYNVGDGNDSIVGFNNTTTLRIEDSDYSTQVSSSDIIVTVGEGKITLVGAASLGSVNIIKSLTLTDSSATNVTISSSTESVGATNRTTAINIVGNTLANTIVGGSGNDTISGGGGTDLVFGGAGNDSLNGDDDNDTLNGDEGNDILSGGKGDDSLLGGNGNDSLNGNEDNDILIGGAGDDTLTGDSGEDIFVYTSGNDIITDYTPSEDKISLGAAISNASLATVSDSDVLLTVGQDTLTVKNAKNKIITFVDQSGNNWFEKFGDDKTISGSEGDDLINHSGDNIKIATGAGNDSVYNTGNDVTIDAGDGNDSIKSGNLVITSSGTILDVLTKKVSINGGAGSDTIYNYVNSATIDGGDDNDYIQNGTPSYPTGDCGSNVTLNGGAGDDTIHNEGYSALISSGDGNDYVRNLNQGYSYNDKLASNVSISTAEGDDTVENTGASVSVDVGEGNNYVQTRRGSFLTITSGAGNDTVRNTSWIPGYGTPKYSGNNISIDAGDGNNLIDNQGSNSTIKSGVGDDTIRNFYFDDAHNAAGGPYAGGDNVSIDAGDGNDSISNHGTNVTINAGKGDNTISNGYSQQSSGRGDESSIVSGSGNNSIQNNGWNSTINAGEGKNTIDNKGENLLVQHTGDNYLINGFNETSTLQTTAKTLHASSNGKDVFLRLGQNTVTLTNGTSLETLNVIDQDGNKIELTNTSNINDFILNNRSSLSIDSGAVNDFIRNNEFFNNVTISSGAGNDTIFNKGGNAIISGGIGTDLISLGSFGSNAMIIYDLDDGDDLITGFSENSTLQILSGTVDKATSSSKNIYLTIGEYTVTLKNAMGLEKLNIVDKDGNKIDLTKETDRDDYLYISEPNLTISGGKGNNVIRLASHTTVIRHKSGNDLIKGFDETSTLQISGDNPTPTIMACPKVGDYVIETPEGTITLESSGNLMKLPKIIDENGKECQFVIGEINENGTYTNLNDRHRYWTINGSDGDDTITAPDNYDHHNSLDGGRGNDYISNNGTDTTIHGGDGDDTIETCPNASDNDIDGGSGDDLFDIHGPNSKVNGGAGDDTIQGGGRGERYSGGGRGNEYDGGSGNDVETNGNREDIGNEIRNKTKQAKNDAEEIRDKANEELSKQIEATNEISAKDIYEDIQKNGMRSKYLQGLSTIEKIELVHWTKEGHYDNLLLDALFGVVNGTRIILFYMLPDIITECHGDYWSLVEYEDEKEYIEKMESLLEKCIKNHKETATNTNETKLNELDANINSTVDDNVKMWSSGVDVGTSFLPPGVRDCW